MQTFLQGYKEDELCGKFRCSPPAGSGGAVAMSAGRIVHAGCLLKLGRLAKTWKRYLQS